MENHKPENDVKLFEGILRLNAKHLGLIFGLLAGLAIFIATNWLLIKAEVTPGGQRVVGPHLRLLSQFFIGYRVTFLGSILGFVYGFAIGSIAGTAIGFFYNKIADWRRR